MRRAKLVPLKKGDLVQYATMYNRREDPARYESSIGIIVGQDPITEHDDQTYYTVSWISHNFPDHAVKDPSGWQRLVLKKIGHVEVDDGPV